MIYTNTIYKTILTGITLCFISCKNENYNPEKEIEKITAKTITHTKKDSTPSNELYYYSKTNNTKYNHKITGKDNNGKNVKGEINLEGEIGIGVIKKEDDDEIEIISEQIDSERIIATDINGFRYKLKIDDE